MPCHFRALCYISAMGELSESLKKVSLGSILVVVGVVSIMTLAVYWYVFSEVPSSIPYSNLQREQVQPENAGTPAQKSTQARDSHSGPDDRTVIVETPSEEPRAQTVEPGTSPDLSGQGTAVETNQAAPGAISVQVGAFSKPDGAAKLASDLSSKGYNPLTNSSEGMYRVFVGEFSSREEAGKTLESLKASGFSGYVRTVP